MTVLSGRGKVGGESANLDLQECKVPQLKDMIHTCWETDTPVCGMNFNSKKGMDGGGGHSARKWL